MAGLRPSASNRHFGLGRTDACRTSWPNAARRRRKRYRLRFVRQHNQLDYEPAKYQSGFTSRCRLLDTIQLTSSASSHQMASCDAEYNNGHAVVSELDKISKQPCSSSTSSTGVRRLQGCRYQSLVLVQQKQHLVPVLWHLHIIGACVAGSLRHTLPLQDAVAAAGIRQYTTSKQLISSSKIGSSRTRTSTVSSLSAAALVGTAANAMANGAAVAIAFQSTQAAAAVLKVMVFFQSCCFKLKLPPQTCSVGWLRQTVANWLGGGVDADTLRLLYAGRELDSAKDRQPFVLQRAAKVLHVVMRMTGG